MNITTLCVEKIYIIFPGEILIRNLRKHAVTVFIIQNALQTSQYFLSLRSLTFTVIRNHMPRLTTISRVTCNESQFAKVYF